MRKIHLTRRLKITTGIIVIVLTAVLVMGFGTGLPGTGQKFMGTATKGYDQGTCVYLMSDWLGAATGVLTVTNTYPDEMLVTAYKHAGGDYRKMGEDILDPGETKSYDYKGICMVRFYYLAKTPEYYINYIEWKKDGFRWYFVNLANPDWTERGSGGGAGNELNLR